MKKINALRLKADIAQFIKEQNVSLLLRIVTAVLDNAARDLVEDAETYPEYQEGATLLRRCANVVNNLKDQTLGVV